MVVVSWVLVYLAMAFHQGSLHANPKNWISGGIEPATAYQFGSLTSEDVFRGQVWRALTATFLHFSLVHLAINALVMYQLGREIEPWYGRWNFLALLVAIGSLSNLLASFLRPWLNQSVTGQSGGGSGIICGFIGMVAVIGWRERSRFGNYMLGQMAIQLVFIGLMGILLPNVDNLVHASGALVGALAAFLDRPLQLSRDTPLARKTGALAIVLVVAAALAQFLGNQADRRAQLRTRVRAELVARELLALPVLQATYLRLASSRSNILWHDPDAAFHARDRARQLLLTTVRTLVALDRKTHAIQDLPLASTWLELAQQPLKNRPHPGTIRRFLDLQRTIATSLRDREIALIREVARWDARLGPPKAPATPPKPAARN
jgi:membrane associated rhomboid family serine protease